ncbi:hypothetical protein [Allostreptomyces psammosilenae]|uniref:Uncharacterized protein n=1 Tax=Allostreptomyces psammosilenae TaxID=1892865 RepID=A0A852ZZ88_9ACTN|nr:hypothetical protein [Allostreptomyces psammosilenae]NYI03438.1 hypothetical protein [Allostreptomyces psammosilenae]
MTTPAPHIVIGHHPQHGVIATNPLGLPSVAHVLGRLGFQPHADEPFHTLTGDTSPERVRQAVILLQRSGYTVVADIRYQAEPTPPARPPAPAPTPQPAQPQAGLPLTVDVVFAREATLGVVASVALTRTHAHNVMRQTGFRHEPTLGLYYLPAGTSPEAARVAVTTAVTRLQAARLRVVADPRVFLPTLTAGESTRLARDHTADRARAAQATSPRTPTPHHTGPTTPAPAQPYPAGPAPTARPTQGR